jgi:hypothetical protein
MSTLLTNSLSKDSKMFVYFNQVITSSTLRSLHNDQVDAPIPFNIRNISNVQRNIAPPILTFQLAAVADRAEELDRRYKYMFNLTFNLKIFYALDNSSHASLGRVNQRSFWKSSDNSTSATSFCRSASTESNRTLASSM